MSLPVTVNDVVDVGEQFVIEAVYEVNVTGADQLYEVAPPALRVSVVPLQMVSIAETLTVGLGTGLTVKVLVLVHPLLSAPVME